MSARPESPDSSPDCHAVADEFAYRLQELDPGYLRMLQQFLQVRLGTGAEQPCDVERTHVLSTTSTRRLAATSALRADNRPGVSPASSRN